MRRSVAGNRDADRAEAARALVVYLIGEHARQQSVKVLVRQGGKLHQTRVQTLELCLRHGVQIHTRWVVLAGL
jgi:hypothetical protein